MKNIYLIIGEGACGKSSLVRALTGVYRSCSTMVRETGGTDIAMKVFTQSAQEANKVPQDILNDIDNAIENNVLIVLRIHPHLIPFTAQQYVQLIAQHHTIVKTIFISQNTSAPYFSIAGSQRGIISDSYSRTVNANANMARRFWNWE